METNTLNAERYYVAVKPQINEIHSVHREGCPFMPKDNKRIYLGIFPTGNEAGEEGRKYFDKSHGCRFCSKESFADESHNHAGGFEPSVTGYILGFLN